MIDAETLLYTLLGRDKPLGTQLSENVDQYSIEEFPFINYSVAGLTQNANGDGLWSVFLDLNVFDDEGNAFSVASSLYDSIHLWDTANDGIVPGVGWVAQVTDISAFSQVDNPLIQGRTVTQYAGSFALLLRE